MDMQSVDNAIKILISDYFKRKRYECGLTGKEMGELLCLSQQHVSRYERYESNIPLSTMIFFLKSKDFNIDAFFNYLSVGICSYYEITNNHNNEYYAYDILLSKK